MIILLIMFAPPLAVEPPRPTKPSIELESGSPSSWNRDIESPRAPLWIDARGSPLLSAAILGRGWPGASPPWTWALVLDVALQLADRPLPLPVPLERTVGGVRGEIPARLRRHIIELVVRADDDGRDAVRLGVDPLAEVRLHQVRLDGEAVAPGDEPAAHLNPHLRPNLRPPPRRRVSQGGSAEAATRGRAQGAWGKLGRAVAGACLEPPPDIKPLELVDGDERRVLGADVHEAPVVKRRLRDLPIDLHVHGDGVKRHPPLLVLVALADIGMLWHRHRGDWLGLQRLVKRLPRRAVEPVLDDVARLVIHHAPAHVRAFPRGAEARGEPPGRHGSGMDPCRRMP
mmetsp:Transcript_67974/g.215021  ORF Transcript_67974/g.215021 Transcript_67974/m.215021 type:complete len:343 (+) Transcript_67974:99-1127(+)